MTQHTSNPNIPTPSQFGPYQGTPPPPQKNGIGLAALIVAIVGFLFACIPGALIIGWVLLPVAFILSIVGLTRSGRKKGTSIAAMVISVIGTIVGFVVFATVVSDACDEDFSSSDFSGDQANPDDPAVTDESADTDDSGANEDAAHGAPGSRDNPVPIGQEVSNDDWRITLGEPHEATDAA